MKRKNGLPRYMYKAFVMRKNGTLHSIINFDGYEGHAWKKSGHALCRLAIKIGGYVHKKLFAQYNRGVLSRARDKSYGIHGFIRLVDAKDWGRSFGCVEIGSKMVFGRVIVPKTAKRMDRCCFRSGCLAVSEIRVPKTMKEL